MGGGRSKDGTPVYYRRGGRYFRWDEKEIKRKEKKEPEKSFRDRVNEAKTNAELLSVLREKYETTDDFVEKNDIEKIKRVVSTLEEMQERYPILGNFIKRLSESKIGIASMDNYGNLTINSNYYGLTGHSSGWYQKTRGWWPPNASPESMIAHEFGHAMHNAFFNKLMRQPGTLSDFDKLFKQKNTGGYLRDIEKAVMKKVGVKTKRELYRQISGYSSYAEDHKSTKGNIIRVGVFEAIAESFADVYSNGDNASPASKAFVEELVNALQ